MKVKANRVMVSLPDSYVYDLSRFSKELSLSKSDIIRRALDNYFKQIGESK